MSRARHLRRALIVLFAPLGGCFGLCSNPDPPTDPCELDPLGCESPDHIDIDPACALAGDLVVAVGEGEADLVLLAPGESPTIHYGAQGGQHMFLGVRVDDPALDYPGLEIDFSVVAAPCDVDDAACTWMDFGQRHVVVTDPDLLKITGAALETTGYVVILESDPEWAADGGWVRVVLRAEVTDACGRTGTGVFDYVIGTPPASTSTGADASTSTG